MNTLNLSTPEDFEEFKKKLLNLDSEFRFKCRKCGKCCTHQHTILLNTRDIFRIAKRMNLTMEAVINKYAETYIGDTSFVPVVHLLPRGKREECPFLSDGRCSIHECKPTVCAIYPLGRILLNDEVNPDEKNVRYMIVNTSCGSQKQRHTVREWLSRFNVPEHDDFFILWSKVLASLTKSFHKLVDKGVSEEFMNTLYDIVYAKLYVEYNINQDFDTQFQQSTEKLLSFTQIIEEEFLNSNTED